MKRPDHAIPVDFVPRRVLKLPGRLGLTQAPGTWDGEPLPSDQVAEGQLAADLVALSEHHGVQALLTLQEEDELEQCGLGGLLGGVLTLGIESLWFPIPDGRAPVSPAEVEATIDRVVELLEAGKTVAIHCLGGLGRSGTIAAAVLVKLGGRPGTAIARVRAARPGAIQTNEQERFVWAYARFVTSRKEP
jgi:protein-tyrosine phosphatase